MKKIFCVVVLSLMALYVNAQYVNLGLPSGTKWKSYNESDLYNYDSAIKQFGKDMPSVRQWHELLDYCTWTWIGQGYLITGSNGNNIVLPASGYRSCDESETRGEGSDGGYWIYSADYEDLVWNLSFDESDKILEESDNPDFYNCLNFSIRLISSK